MKTPSTHTELFHAIRELVGPNRYVSVSAGIGQHRAGGGYRLEWNVYVSADRGDGFSTDFQPSLAAAWEACKAHFAPGESSIEAGQFDAPAEVEARG